MNAKGHASIEKIINIILNDVTGKDIQYVDVRVVEHDTETFSASANNAVEIETTANLGFGVRVLRQGAWGYAASVVVSPEEALKVGRRASALALASAVIQQQPISLSAVKPVQTHWITPHSIDPFMVSNEEKEALLSSALKLAVADSQVSTASGYVNFQRRRSSFGASNGSRIKQEILISGIALSITAGEGRNSQTRSWPSSHGGYTCTGGLERIKALITPESMARASSEAVEMLSAPPCPEGVFDVLIAPDQMSLQIHESIGHPLELDRVFGVEANFSGTSFATVDQLGKLKYGASLLNVVTDPSESGVLGGYGYDDDGVQAQPVDLIKDGILVGYLSGRETAARINRLSSANNRAAGWNHYPINRMSNIRIEPGNESLDDLLAGVGNGIYLASNRSWSIDDHRENFRFECEVAREIKNGKLGRLLLNPSYTGRTLEFWNSCTGIGNAGLYENWGTPTCGKGEPSQTIHTSQGSPPMRFKGVSIAPSVKKKGHPHG